MIARTITKLRGALLGAAAAALVLTTTTALAGSGVGGVFNLGVANTVDAPSSLSGDPGANPELRVTNTGASGAGIRADAQAGTAVTGNSVSGTGQLGQSQSGIGLIGIHAATTGINPGVQGSTNSTDSKAAGVLGKNMGGGPGLSATVKTGVPPLAVNSQGRVANLNADLLDGLDSSRLWKLGGNTGTTAGTDFLGTSDNTALELKVNGQRALRVEPNAISPNLIGGAPANTVAAGQYGAVIAGGGTNDPGGVNHAEAPYDFIGAGYGNQAGSSGAEGASGVVAGTENVASGGRAFVGAGQSNTASGVYSTIAGGWDNAASAYLSTVAGGYRNAASGELSAVPGGYGNTASGNSSAVAGGFSNTASGELSFAAGTQAQATQNGSFVWGDRTFIDLIAPGANTFTVRASGGIWLGTTSSPAITPGHFIDTSTGAYLSSSGAWTNNSDRALKHDFQPLNERSLLEKVAQMPIVSWSYKAEKPSVRHIGPMAQDFYKALGLGLDNKHITTIDEGGVALAAIQGLVRQNQSLQRKNAALSTRLGRLERAVASLRRD
jgi:hypothetical protein